MRPQSNRVILRGVQADETLLKFLDRQIRKRILREQSLLFLPRDSSYHVEVEKEENSTLYKCLLKVRIGSREWLAQDYGESVQDGLKLALRRLRLLPQPV